MKITYEKTKSMTSNIGEKIIKAKSIAQIIGEKLIIVFTVGIFAVMAEHLFHTNTAQSALFAGLAIVMVCIGISRAIDPEFKTLLPDTGAMIIVLSAIGGFVIGGFTNFIGHPVPGALVWGCSMMAFGPWMIVQTLRARFLGARDEK